MSTPVQATEPAAARADALRLVSIAVDLLPPEVVAARRTRKVRRLVLTSLGVFVVLLLAWFGLAKYQTSTARDELTAAEDNVQSMLKQQREYDGLVKIQDESRAIKAQLSTLFADDLQWATLTSAVQDIAPSGVRLNRVSGVLNEGPAAEANDPNTPRLPNTSGQRLIGQLTISGVGSSKRLVAAYVDALVRVKGLANPLLSDASQQEAGLQFTVQVDITQAALGGRYSTPKGR